MADWRKTKTPGVYVSHSLSAPSRRTRGRVAAASHRGAAGVGTRRPAGRVAEAGDQGPRRGPRPGSARTARRADHLEEQAAEARPFEELGDEWLDGVEAGRISRRRGRGKPYTRDDDRGLPALVPQRPRARVRRDGRRRASANSSGRCGATGSAARGSPARGSRAHVAVASAIYAWAITPTRRYVVAQSAAPHRAAAQRREAAPPRRVRDGGGAAARRARARGRACRTRSPSTPACAARRSTGSSGPTCWPAADRDAAARHALEERGGPRAPAADRGAAAHVLARGVAPPGPTGATASSSSAR